MSSKAVYFALGFTLLLVVVAVMALVANSSSQDSALVPVSELARLVKDETIRSRLLKAETPREFIEALTAENL